MTDVFCEIKNTPFSCHIDNLLSPLPHMHKDIEIIYVIDGESQAIADNKMHIIRSGDVFITFPNQIHYYLNSTAGQYMIFIFSPDILYEINKILYNNIPAENVLNNDQKKNTIESINAITGLKGQFATTITIGMINQFTAVLLDKIQLLPRIHTHNTTLQSILNYCSSHFSENLSLDTVSKGLNISKFYISHIFSTNFKISFTEYINSLRIGAACDLLKNSDKNIADISEEAGFGSLRTFNRAFSKAMNMPPFAYRKHFKTLKKS